MFLHGLAGAEAESREVNGYRLLDNGVLPYLLTDPVRPLTILNIGLLIVTVVRVDTVSGDKGWQLLVFTTETQLTSRLPEP